MDSKIRKLCRRELRAYKQMQALTKTLPSSKLLCPEIFVAISQKLLIIDDIYTGLSPITKEYVKYRYFDKNECRISEYADLYHCDERTVRRWDEDILRQLYEQLNIFGCILLNVKNKKDLAS